MAGWTEVSAEDGELLSYDCLIAVESIRRLVFKNVGQFKVLHDGHFAWKISSYSNLPGKAFSPEFLVGDVKWQA